MAYHIEIINKYEFYNKFIQFLYPSLIITIGNEEEKKQHDEHNDEKECNSSLYNSSTFNLCMNDDAQMDKIKVLIMDLRDQGSEYFTKLLVIIQNNNNNDDKNTQELIKQCCQQITISSKSIKTFLILNNHNNECVYKILTTNWYNTFKTRSNINNCLGFPSLPSMIENNLFVGGRITVQNLFILKSLNITVVINCTKDCPNYFESDNNMTYHRISIDDQDNENIILYLQQCYKLLNDAIDNKNLTVCIHCEQGKSRSVSMIIYYLMQKHKFDVQQALQYVKNLRPIASPNKGFMHQLQQMYEQQKKKSGN